MHKEAVINPKLNEENSKEPKVDKRCVGIGKESDQTKEVFIIDDTYNQELGATFFETTVGAQANSEYR